MGEVEIVPEPGMTPQEFVKFAVARAKSGREGYIVFKKEIGGRTIVLRIGPSGYGGYTATVQLRQGSSRYPEPGGELKDITVEAGCELYAWLNAPEALDTMQKALVSPNGQALALCALFRLLAAHNTLHNGMREAENAQKEIAQ